MGYINVFISNPCKISIQHNSILLSGDSERRYVLQDINSIMVECRECSITSYVFAELAKANIVIYFCDDKHMPISVVTPYNTYCRQLEMFGMQQNAKKPTIKKIWQSIVQQKISNEAICLDLLGIDGGELLDNIAASVYSGDTGNGEAHAAQIYFKQLFGDEFSRNQDNIVNAALNYTYAIVRGLISRSLVVYGFVPYIGLHHRSILNNYNLSDDIIEPFRAICDYYVLDVIGNAHQLDTQLKAKLYSIVNIDVKIDGENHSLTNAVDKMIVSLKYSLTNNECRLNMPILIGSNMHRYE